MKKDIHPTYFKEAKAVCACGKSFSIGSTKESIQVEICSFCHPFYTGDSKIIDTAGRVEKFKNRQATAKSKAEEKAEKKSAPKPTPKETPKKEEKKEEKKQEKKSAKKPTKKSAK